MTIDTRFYERRAALTAQEIAGELRAELAGNPFCAVSDVSSSSEPSPGSLVFVSSEILPDALRQYEGVIIGPRLPEDRDALHEGASFIVHAQPKVAFAVIAARLVSPRLATGREAVSPEAAIADSAAIGAGAVISAGAQIGEGSVIGPNAVIGPGVVIGAGTRVGACAVIGFSVIGRDCGIGPGCVIGEPGFGLVAGPTGPLELPHFGRVLIGDRVRLGGNCTVDRGMFGDTRLRDGVKLDNLCHIAHNVDIGEYTVMAALGGIAGSVTVGRGCQFGGRVAIKDHIRIGNGVKLAGNASPIEDVPDGETWAGQPAQPIRNWMRELLVLKRQAATTRRAARAGRVAGPDGQDD